MSSNHNLSNHQEHLQWANTPRPFGAAPTEAIMVGLLTSLQQFMQS